MESRRVDGARALGREGTSTLVAIGNFDGVHRGHRVVLKAAASLARERNLLPVVLTFDPHPAEVLGRGRQAVLTVLDRKIELIGRIDPAIRVVVEPFTLELAGKTPEQFAKELLSDALGARVVMVGQNFRFGHRRAGDLQALSTLGRELGFEARAEALTGDTAGTFSSSRIRAAIAQGDVEGAEKILGRPHALSGTVVRGDGRGRTIGVPTANLRGVPEALPPYGVYACLLDRVRPLGAQRLGMGVLNIGERPTVDAGFSVEIHVLDFDANLYGEELRLHLVTRIREERRFSGLDALKEQIRADIEVARGTLTARRPAPDAGVGWY